MAKRIVINLSDDTYAFDFVGDVCVEWSQEDAQVIVTQRTDEEWQGMVESPAVESIHIMEADE